MRIEPHSRRIPYQPALDGVRGVAVAAVLAYHGGMAWARGGFLGVDVFFVLSGYLITAILVAEWQQRRAIDFVAFWARRARRLLPALVVVVAAVALVARLLVPAQQLVALRGDGLAGLFYVGNWRMVLSGRSYFDQFADPSPLLHLWSLGVEEQWYLLWPLVLAGALRVTRGRTRALLPASLAAAAASATLMAVLAPAHGDPSRVYYGTDTRAQALLVGAALAFLLGRADRSWWTPARRVAARGAGVAGAAMLLLAWAAIDDQTGWMYRGGYAAIALAAGGVVAAAVAPEGGLRRVLAAAPLREAGRISYGLYLWHWPVYLALTPGRTGVGGVALLVVRVAVTVAVAVVSFRFVESPIREGRLPDWRAPAAAAAALATVSALVLAVTWGARPLFTPSATGALAAPAPGAPPSSPGAAPTETVPPRVPPPPDRVRVVLAGDSVAFSLGYHYRPEWAGGARMRMAAILGCGVARGRAVVNGKVSPPSSRCEQWPAQWRQAVDSFDPDVAVIMVGAWEVFDRQVGGQVLRVGTPEYESYLAGELQTGYDELAARGAPVALLDVPCFSEPDLAVGKPPSERNDPRRVAAVNRVFADFAARHPRVRVIDLAGFLCPGGKDVGRLGGAQVRVDGVHFTPAGAEAVWRWLGPQLVDLATHPPR